MQVRKLPSDDIRGDSQASPSSELTETSEKAILKTLPVSALVKALLLRTLISTRDNAAEFVSACLRPRSRMRGRAEPNSVPADTAQAMNMVRRLQSVIMAIRQNARRGLPQMFNLVSISDTRSFFGSS